MRDSEWITVKLPKELAAEIDRVGRRGNLGYSSRAELVKEAVRTYLAGLKKKPPIMVCHISMSFSFAAFEWCCEWLSVRNIELQA